MYICNGSLLVRFVSIVAVYNIETGKKLFIFKGGAFFLKMCYYSYKLGTHHYPLAYKNYVSP